MKEFRKIIESISRRWSISQVFDDYRIYLPETGLMVRRISAESAKHLMTTERKPHRVVEKPADPVQENPVPAVKHRQPEIFWP